MSTSRNSQIAMLGKYATRTSSPRLLPSLFLTLFLTLLSAPSSLSRSRSLLDTQPDGSPVPFSRIRQHHRQRQATARRNLFTDVEEALKQQEASRNEEHSSSSSSSKKGSSKKPNITLQGSGMGVLTGTVRVYLIYYGNWSGKSDVIENFIYSLSNKSETPKDVVKNNPKDWWNLVRAYTNKDGKAVGKVIFGGRTFDNYSYGSDITHMVGTIVYTNLDKKKLPVDNKGVYVVLTSADVKETPKDGFCAGTYPPPPNGTQIGYCGWHYSFFDDKLGDIAYAFVGNPNQCVKRCGQLQGMRRTPNGDIGIDAMVNVMAHEIAEAATDFDAETGWFDEHLGESADLCNRNFGAMTLSKDGMYKYNMVGQGGMRWLVQQMWDLNTSSCAMRKA